VTVEAESTLNAIISFAFIEVVQVDKVLSWFFCADDNVGFSEPAIESATDGGKVAYVSLQTSITIEPTWSPKISHPVIVPPKGITAYPLIPVVIAEPPPSITIPNDDEPDGVIPLVPAVPDTPLVPDVPLAPVNPEVPEVPFTPDNPDVPLVPAKPDVPLVPEPPPDALEPTGVLFQALLATAAGGNFNATGTWVGGVVPIAGDDIIANATSGNLTLTATPANLSGANFTGYTGTFAMGTQNLNSSGTVTLGSGMTITGSVGSARIQPLSGGALTIVSNGKKIPGVGTQGASTVTFSGTASVGQIYNNGVLTGANMILHGTQIQSGTLPTLSAPHILYIKPDATMTFGSTTALIGVSPRVIFDTTNTINTAGAIVVSVGSSSIQFLQTPAFNLGTLTQSAIVYQPPNGTNAHTIDFGSTGFKLDRLMFLTGNSATSSNTFSILGTSSFGTVTVTLASLNTTAGLSASITSFVAERNVNIDEMVVTSEYSRNVTQAAVTLGRAIRNTVRFSAGVTYSISSFNSSGVPISKLFAFSTFALLEPVA